MTMLLQSRERMAERVRVQGDGGREWSTRQKKRPTYRDDRAASLVAYRPVVLAAIKSAQWEGSCHRALRAFGSPSDSQEWLCPSRAPRARNCWPSRVLRLRYDCTSWIAAISAATTRLRWPHTSWSTRK